MKNKIIIIAIICILIDFISKLLVTSNLNIGESITVISSFFSITYIENTGAAWGMLSNGTLVLAALSIIFLGFAVKYIYDLKKVTWFNAISYGMLLGGIVGNLIDRIFRNYVIDFLNFNIFGYNFPIFNIADCFIVISIFLIVIDTLLEEEKK